MKDLKETIKKLDKIFEKEYGKKPKTKQDLAWEKLKRESLKELPREINKKGRKTNVYRK